MRLNPVKCPVCGSPLIEHSCTVCGYVPRTVEDMVSNALENIKEERVGNIRHLLFEAIENYDEEKIKSCVNELRLIEPDDDVGIVLACFFTSSGSHDGYRNVLSICPKFTPAQKEFLYPVILDHAWPEDKEPLLEFLKLQGDEKEASRLNRADPPKATKIEETPEVEEKEDYFQKGYALYTGDAMKKPHYRKAVSYFKKAAKLGSPAGSYYYALCLDEGRGCFKNVKKAAKLYSFASDNNCFEASYRLGLLYKEGSGVDLSCTQAEHYFSLAAEKDHLKAIYELGELCLHGKGMDADLDKAEYLFYRGAENNDPDCAFAVGKMRYERLFRYRESTFTFAKNASKFGRENAISMQQTTPLPYEEGKSLPRDFYSAAHFLRHKANEGLAEAEFLLGNCYFYGIGVAKALQLANKLFWSSFDHGYTEAYEQVIYSSQGIADATDVLRQFVEMGIPGAKREYGKTLLRISELRHNAPLDPRRGFSYLVAAAKEDDAEAQFIVGKMYTEGYQFSNLSLRPNKKRGQQWLEFAAAQGHPKAREYLKNHYYRHRR